MRYTPPAVPAADHATAIKPSIGGEKRLYASDESADELGLLQWVAAGSGTWTPDEVSVLPAAGADLAIIVQDELVSSQATVIWVSGTGDDSNPLTGSGILTPPAYVRNKGFSFQHGAAVDVLAARKFRTITNVWVGSGGTATSKVKLFRLPETWTQIGCVEQVDPSIGIRSPVPIACGLDGAAFVLSGRSEPSSVTVRAKHFSIVDGLMRFGGRSCCLRMDVSKAGVLLVERHVFGNAVLSVNNAWGDGNDEVVDAATGMFETFAGFYAG